MGPAAVPQAVTKAATTRCSACFAMGEGWHHTHHTFPTSARHGLRWWQLDVSYWVIRALELVGLAWNVKLPSRAAQRESAARRDPTRPCLVVLGWSPGFRRASSQTWRKPGLQPQPLHAPRRTVLRQCALCAARRAQNLENSIYCTTGTRSPRSPPPASARPAGRAKGLPPMRYPVELENIEALRLSQDIDDVELRAEVRALRAGDAVKLTFLNAKKASAGETLLVRIDRTDGRAFHGTLVQPPASKDLPEPAGRSRGHVHQGPRSLDSRYGRRQALTHPPGLPAARRITCPSAVSARITAGHFSPAFEANSVGRSMRGGFAGS